MKRLLFAALLLVPLVAVGGGPKRVDQTLCYDWDPVTKICGSNVTIHTDASELHGNLHRADTLRQVKAADLGYEALNGRQLDPIVDAAAPCDWGDPSCATCKTRFAVGTLTACDGACVDCQIRPKRQ